MENRSLSPAVVRSVHLLFVECYIQIFNSDDDGECIIDGFKTATIMMKPFSKIIVNGDEVRLDTVPDLNAEGNSVCYLCAWASKETISSRT